MSIDVSHHPEKRSVRTLIYRRARACPSPTSVSPKAHRDAGGLSSSSSWTPRFRQPQHISILPETVVILPDAADAESKLPIECMRRHIRNSYFQEDLAAAVVRDELQRRGEEIFGNAASPMRSGDSEIVEMPLIGDYPKHDVSNDVLGKPRDIKMLVRLWFAESHSEIGCTPRRGKRLVFNHHYLLQIC